MMTSEQRDAAILAAFPDVAVQPYLVDAGDTLFVTAGDRMWTIVLYSDDDGFMYPYPWIDGHIASTPDRRIPFTW